jgi:hypothetical protein
MVVLTSGVARGAVPPLSPQKLRDRSDAVVVGEIQSHTSELKKSSHGAVHRHYTIRLRVGSVEKAAPEIAAGKIVTVRGWNVHSVRVGITGSTGNYTIDSGRSLGDVLRDTKSLNVQARFYLSSTDGEFHILTPNGLEILRSSPR